MNKDNAKDYLPLVQALADGKDLEWRDTYETWHPIDEAGFGYEPERYRIKPEPREFWVVEYITTAGVRRTSAYATEEEARETANHPCVRGASKDGNICMLKVREVCS